MTERDTVELIFFPTGGGKTEAYLALAAFSLLLPAAAGPGGRRRRCPDALHAAAADGAAVPAGSRAHLRNGAPPAARSPTLGDASFTIGIWLGRCVTPNDRRGGTALRTRARSGEAERRKPVRAAALPLVRGPDGADQASARPRAAAKTPKVAGYVATRADRRLRCPDQQLRVRTRSCPFYVVDEDIYEQRPIARHRHGGQVRHAGLAAGGALPVRARRRQARERLAAQPDHPGRAAPDLRSARLDGRPLRGGDRGAVHRPPRGVRQRRRSSSSTATIRRFEQQIKDLYARTDAVLFPPRGLDAGDSFFARYARDADRRPAARAGYTSGFMEPGLGSHADGAGATFASLLQAPMPLRAADRDPWWTLMVFFNSLRELGTRCRCSSRTSPTT